ncbi:MAG: FAD binding domain-containing protein [Alcanivorax sp.]|uniref:FAD binding domain-containing protein n=1 Tax=Alloalcanivorax marinus TaxID=1177169 RepID=UPI00195D0A16|nr:FAD binding domain-containing protein [Alloalcanivorax marinus]MBM7334239.1 FAD binding domain-containing protein [Alloalcanivorax marinus]MCU5785359.1 carbon monoxide dehydrogenase [Alloalcanivorax marinus]
MKPVKFDYLPARDGAEAVRLLTEHGDEAKCIAGGQSLGPMLNLRLARPAVLVDLHRAEDLTGVEESRDAIVYGGAVRHADFEDGRVPDAARGMLPLVASRIAYRAVRNRGTLGGSLSHADPAADWVCVMTGLGATYLLRGKKGVREVAAENFIQAAFMTELAPNEILAGVRVPRLSDSARWGYYKFCKKVGEFSQATGVVVVDPERGYCRVLVGALDSPPVPLEPVAEALAAEGPDGAVAVLDAAVDTALGDYPQVNRQLYKVAVRRALAQIGATR